MAITVTDQDIPKVAGGLLPEGILLCEGVEMEVTYSANGKRMIKIQFKVEEPEAAYGRFGFNNFVLGTETDLDADQDVETWKNFGPSLYKEQLHAANYTGLGSINYADHKTQDDLCVAYPGTKFLVECYNTKQKGGDYDGSEQNNFRYHKIGTKAVGLKGAKPMQSAPMSAPPKAPIPPAPPAVSAPSAPVPHAAPAPPVSVPSPVETAEVVEGIHCEMCKERGEAVQDYAGAVEYKAHLQECIQKNMAAQGV